MGRPPSKVHKKKHTITLDPGVFSKLLKKVGNVSEWVNSKAKEEIAK